MAVIRIGIDPGKDSYIAVFVNGLLDFYQIPLVGKEVDIKELNKIFSNGMFVGQNVHAVIEDVHALFGSSASGTWEFSKVTAILETLLVVNSIPFTKVQPKKWQKEMWEGVKVVTKPSSTGKTLKTDTKAMSEIAAKRLFPDVDLRKSERSKLSDHNKVDALLIAEYCKRNF